MVSARRPRKASVHYCEAEKLHYGDGLSKRLSGLGDFCGGVVHSLSVGTETTSRSCPSSLCVSPEPENGDGVGDSWGARLRAMDNRPSCYRAGRTLFQSRSTAFPSAQ